MSFVFTLEPEFDPLALDEVKEHLVVESTDRDGYICGLIKRAISNFESITNSVIAAQTWSMKMDYFDACELNRIDKGPLLTVTSINYMNSAGIWTLLPSTEYRVDNSSYIGRIVPAIGRVWPTTYDDIDTVNIVLRFGYADYDAVPYDIKAALLMNIANWHEHPEGLVENRFSAMANGAADIMSRYRIY